VIDNLRDTLLDLTVEMMTAAVGNTLYTPSWPIWTATAETALAAKGSDAGTRGLLDSHTALHDNARAYANEVDLPGMLINVVGGALWHSLYLGDILEVVDSDEPLPGDDTTREIVTELLQCTAVASIQAYSIPLVLQVSRINMAKEDWEPDTGDRFDRAAEILRMYGPTVPIMTLSCVIELIDDPMFVRWRAKMLPFSDYYSQA